MGCDPTCHPGGKPASPGPRGVRESHTTPLQAARFRLSARRTQLRAGAFGAGLRAAAMKTGDGGRPLPAPGGSCPTADSDDFFDRCMRGDGADLEPGGHCVNVC